MIELKQEIVERLSSKGILAYVAASIAGSGEASTAALAGLVKAQTGVMLEGLKELAVEAPDAVRASGRGKWQCGALMAGTGVIVQNLDSERYKTFVDDLYTYWNFLNPLIPFSLSGKDGAVIKRFLRDHPDWEREDITKALKHRIISIVKHGAASRSEPFYSWVGSLDKFAAGPINQYGRPVEGSGKHGQAISIEQQNSLARAAVLSGQG